MMKKLIPMTIAIALSAASADAKTKYDGMQQDLDIMQNIMQTALKGKRSKNNYRVRSVNATYLAKQGVVFNVNTSGTYGSLQSFVFPGLYTETFLPDNPPEPPIPTEETIEMSLVEEKQLEAMLSLNERLAEGSFFPQSENQERLRQVTEQKRALEWEIREQKRRKRDLEFEKRTADQKQLKEIQEQLDSSAKELKKTQTEMQKTLEYVNELKQQAKQSREKRMKRVNELRNSFLAQFENKIANVLCKYGAGLKSLPNSENVTFVLNRFGDKRDRKTEDKIYVFSADDVQACVRDKISADKLLTKADVYSF